MSYLSKMYGKNNKTNNDLHPSKNPNRVTGGLRAQGVDRFTLIAEDGSQQELPSIEYVRSLEEQSKKQRAAIDVLERKLARLESSQEKLNSIISRSS